MGEARKKFRKELPQLQQQRRKLLRLLQRLRNLTCDYSIACVPDELRLSFRKKVDHLLFPDPETRKRRREAEPDVQQWECLKQSYQFTCLCCLRQEPEIQLTQDHVTPVRNGGTGDIGNIQPLCKICNSRKSTRKTDYRKFFKSRMAARTRGNVLKTPFKLPRLL